ncbi:MAG: hypothetical protein ACREF4_04695, partial [Gammaproteobacteria bacterium]
MEAAVIGLLALAALAGCGGYDSSGPGGGDGSGGGGGGGAGGGTSSTITVGNDFFSPTPDMVSAGQVTFSWAARSNGHT